MLLLTIAVVAATTQPPSTSAPPTTTIPVTTTMPSVTTTPAPINCGLLALEMQASGAIVDGETFLSGCNASHPGHNISCSCPKGQKVKSGMECGLQRDHVCEACPEWQKCEDGVAKPCDDFKLCYEGEVHDCPDGYRCIGGRTQPCDASYFCSNGKLNSCSGDLFVLPAIGTAGSVVPPSTVENCTCDIGQKPFGQNSCQQCTTGMWCSHSIEHSFKECKLTETGFHSSKGSFCVPTILSETDEYILTFKEYDLTAPPGQAEKQEFEVAVISTMSNLPLELVNITWRVLPGSVSTHQTTPPFLPLMQPSQESKVTIQLKEEASAIQITHAMLQTIIDGVLKETVSRNYVPFVLTGISLALFNQFDCPDGFVCSNGRMYNCPDKKYCENGHIKECFHKDMLVFSADNQETSDSFHVYRNPVPPGSADSCKCKRGLTMGLRGICEACPPGFMCPGRGKPPVQCQVCAANQIQICTNLYSDCLNGLAPGSNASDVQYVLDGPGYFFEGTVVSGYQSLGTLGVIKNRIVAYLDNLFGDIENDAVPIRRRRVMLQALSQPPTYSNINDASSYMPEDALADIRVVIDDGIAEQMSVEQIAVAFGVLIEETQATATVQPAGFSEKFLNDFYELTGSVATQPASPHVTTTPPAATQAQLPATTPTPSNPKSTPTQKDDDDKGNKLSTGALLGIIFGSIIGVFGIAGVVFYLSMQSTSSAENSDEMTAATSSIYYPVSAPHCAYNSVAAYRY
eukprot:1648371-Rhodomonas_salina.2